MEKRFKPQASVLAADRLMNHFIKFGGMGVIAAVMAIFVFITWQIVPLFRSATVTPIKTIDLRVPPNTQLLALGADEWTETPFVAAKDGSVYFVDAQTGLADNPVRPFADRSVQSAYYSQEQKTLMFGLDQGEVGIVQIDFEPVFDGDHRKIEHHVTSQGPFKIASDGSVIASAFGGAEGSPKFMVAATQSESGFGLYAAVLNQRRTPLGPGPMRIGQTWDLTGQLKSKPAHIMIDRLGESAVVTDDEGRFYYFHFDGTQVNLLQTFKPFEGRKDERIATADFVLGGVSVIVSNPEGENRVMSLFRKGDSQVRLFGQTKSFPRLEGAPVSAAVSPRNKGFLIGTDKELSLRYTTTEDIRWRAAFPAGASLVRIGGKYDRLLALDGANKLHLYRLNDPHPEAGWKAFFGKIWYEGFDRPEYSWQSTGATDEFEAKLSLVPLIIGSLKGTLYALLFALPIALLAALYTSQFANPTVKNIAKPMMEIMASLPSVVLGFLAALWLAPLIENRVPSLILIAAALPLTALFCGFIWTKQPRSRTFWVKPGYEFALLAPILLAVGVLLWHLGPWLESWAFLAKDPVTGKTAADFRLWWPQVTGTPFEQRNSLVVGFVMGFAVIPIIFTITEDALSNVAPTLRSASLALGASRWQTAWRVMIPTASAGILSALMVGFGRAVGETMIVVMATGNTPIMDFNIFSGMRTLSANIAVELPEAPFHGTLYRTLYLGALALFLMTFFVNTLAELLRERLRKRYRTV